MARTARCFFAILVLIIITMSTKLSQSTPSQLRRESCPRTTISDLFINHSQRTSSPIKSAINSQLESGSKIKENRTTTWLLGFLFVTIISLASCLGLLIVPTATKLASGVEDTRTEYIHNGLEGLALGSLLASAIFHLIPHAFNLVGEDEDHHYLSKSLLIFCGIQLFYWSERLMVIFGDFQIKRKEDIRIQQLVIQRQQVNHNLRTPNGLKRPLDTLIEEEEPICNCHLRSGHELSRNGHSDSIEVMMSGGHRDTSTLAWMVIFGDGLHNFIDGLSLGAALTDSHLTGFSIAVAILFEEIPHELGDFAILIASGMSPRKAAMANFMSASTCYLGLAVGITIGDLAEGNGLIFALAGGMFLYISLFDIMTELNERFNLARKQSIGKSIKILLIQNVGVFVGIFSLFFLARFDEKSLLRTFGHHS